LYWGRGGEGAWLAAFANIFFPVQKERYSRSPAESGGRGLLLGWDLQEVFFEMGRHQMTIQKPVSMEFFLVQNMKHFPKKKSHFLVLFCVYFISLVFYSNFATNILPKILLN